MTAFSRASHPRGRSGSQTRRAHVREKHPGEGISHQAEDVLMNQQSVRQNQQPVPKRPTEYTKEIGETICGRLVEDENLRSICAEPGLPDVANASRFCPRQSEDRESQAHLSDAS